MNTSIPVYRPDGSLYASVNERRFMRLESAGLISRTVRHRKGQIKRAILFGREEDPTPPQLGAYQGTRYSYMEKLESGRQCWQHKRLTVKDEEGSTLDMRRVFLRVVEDCSTS